MKHIYLDQWVWIRLAQAASGAPREPADLDALNVCRFAAAHDLASFPLSPTHYMELTAGASPRQRAIMTPLIVELSRLHTMRQPGPDILAWELDLYLQRHFGRPIEPRAVQIFGVGVGHAFNYPIRPQLVPKPGAEPAPLDPGVKDYIEKIATEYMELALLTGPPAGATVPGYEPRAHLVFDERFAEEETQMAARFRGLSNERRARVIYASAVVHDVLPVMEEALRRAMLSVVVLPRDREGWTQLLRELPTLWAMLELKRLQHQNPTRPWAPQDHPDLIALTMALVYCDAVVFDKHWSDLVRRAGLDVANGTRLARMRDLPELLVTLAA